MTVRYHILYDFRDGPWGGGNQFLKALKAALEKEDAYSDDPFAADALLFNSHHFGDDETYLPLLKGLKLKKPDMPFIHRIDGPIKLVRGHGRAVDATIFAINQLLADATVFQTSWSRERSRELGYHCKEPVATIMNAPDPAIFFAPENKRRCERLRIVASSWAPNWRKGFDIYQYLDEHLDFERYEMTFIGQSPLEFQNIKHLPPMGSQELATALREHDVYMTASVNDPCSNALCEGLHCGLPALVRDSGGHPEIIGEGGLTFEGKQDVIRVIEAMHANYDIYRQAIAVPQIEDIARLYIDFAAQITKVKPLAKGAVNQVKRRLHFMRIAERTMHIGRKIRGQSE